MKILFVHPNMPGQYKHVAKAMADEKQHEIYFIALPKPNVQIPGITKIEWQLKREPAKETHRYLFPLSTATLRAQEVWRVCHHLKTEKHFTPDVIVGHLGWGDGMFLKDVYPDVPTLSFFEFYYHAHGKDVNFDPEDQLTEDDVARIRMKNAQHLFNLTYSDWGLVPTFFQRDVHPKEFWPKMSVLHDGIDTDVVRPGTGRTLTLPSGIVLKPEDEIITYISRNFEPYRGFPQFMRAAEIILKNRPNAHILMVGQDGVSYGKQLPPGQSWRKNMMEQLNIPQDRFHYLGYLQHQDMLKILHISSVHIYLTVPFVLSWSLMEAMACECLVIGSDTEPVREVIEHEKNGLLVDFFSHQTLAQMVDAVFSHPDRMKDLRKAARQTILERYALKDVLPLHLDLIRDVANKKLPPPTDKRIRKFNKERR